MLWGHRGFLSEFYHFLIISQSIRNQSKSGKLLSGLSQMRQFQDFKNLPEKPDIW